MTIQKLVRRHGGGKEGLEALSQRTAIPAATLRGYMYRASGIGLSYGVRIMQLFPELKPEDLDGSEVQRASELPEVVQEETEVRASTSDIQRYADVLERIVGVLDSMRKPVAEAIGAPVASPVEEFECRVDTSELPGINHGQTVRVRSYGHRSYRASDWLAYGEPERCHIKRDGAPGALGIVIGPVDGERSRA